MGMCTDMMRLSSLTSQKYDLEYQSQLITDTKMQLTRSASELTRVGTDLDPGSPAYAELTKRTERLHAMEKKLDKQLQENDVRLKAIDTEMQSVQGMLSKNIQSSFKYGSM